MLPISCSWLTTSVGAPPCAGPFKAPIAPATALAMSLCVEVMTRAVKVEALKPCSAPTMKYASRPRAERLVGPLAAQLIEEAGRQTERRVGVNRLATSRRRANAARMEGAAAVMARACSTVGGYEQPVIAPHADTPVRSASIAFASAGSWRELDHGRTAAHTRASPTRCGIRRSTTARRPGRTCRAGRARRSGTRDTAAGPCRRR